MAVLDDLPPELLTLIAGHLVTPFTHIPLFPGTFERAPDASGQLAFTPADDEITARHAVEASDLGQLRLVSRIWEETATPWLYARVRVARVERLELLLSAEANRLCRCVRYVCSPTLGCFIVDIVAHNLLGLSSAGSTFLPLLCMSAQRSTIVIPSRAVSSRLF